MRPASLIVTMAIMAGCRLMPTQTGQDLEAFHLLFGSNRMGDWEIYTMNLSSGEEYQLTRSLGDDLWPVWSPDGDEVAFVSTRDGNRELYVMDSSGMGQRRLTFSRGDVDDPVWSPDGKKIAYTSNMDGNEEIYMLDLETLNQIRLTRSDGSDTMPEWSPDGHRILFVSERDGNPEMYILSESEDWKEQPFRLTNHMASDGVDSHIWSPDGGSIVFTSNRNGDLDIYLISAQGLELWNLTEDRSMDDGPAWSPDGGTLAFVSNRHGDFDVYTLPMVKDGARYVASEPTRLTHQKGDDLWPVWSPDGSQLAFISMRDNNPEIYTMDRDGTHQVRWTRNQADEKWVSWGLK